MTARKPIQTADGSGRMIGSTAGYLSAAQAKQVRAAWKAGETQQEIASRIGVSVDTLRARLRDQLVDLPRRGRGAGSRRSGIDPTEEEIYGTLVFVEQASWSDEERARRWQGGGF